MACAGGVGIGGHVCWGFDSETSFERAALEFFGDGLRLGQRLAYVTDEPAERTRECLAALGDVEQLLGSRALELASLAEIYPEHARLDPDAQLARYSAPTERALADGYAGLRVVVRVSELVADPASAHALVRAESIADRYMARHPLAALCAYDSRGVAPELLADLEAVHPARRVRGAGLPFRVFFTDSHTLALEGEVDTFCARALQRLLGLALEAGAPVTLDLGELGFVDHRGLQAIAASAGDAGELTLSRISPAARRLGELLELGI